MRSVLLCLGLLCAALLAAQTKGQLVTAYPATTTFSAPASLPAADYFSLAPEHQLRKAYTHEESGRSHHKYHQFHRGRRVLGGTVVFHTTGDRLRTTSGRLAEFEELPVAKISPAQGRQAARLALTSALLREEIIPDGKLSITEPEAVIATGNFPDNDGAYRPVLTYRATATSQLLPVDRDILVDGLTGRVITILDNIHREEATGTGEGFHLGPVSFPTDSVAPDRFLLHDRSRGGGISAQDFRRNFATAVDKDNHWPAATLSDGTMIDSYVGSLRYYDFLRDHFNRNSIDDAGAPLRTIFGYNHLVNAFYSNGTAYIGNGSCDLFFPLSTMEVVGHEFTHGVTAYTSALVYRNEPGALNESISDIFGKGMEYYYNRANFDWQIGSALARTSQRPYFRNMADPNDRYHAGFYRGTFWFTETWDNGGVHRNSGVMNHWFYLLVEGKSGVNEIGEAYDIPALGMEDGLRLVYHLQTAYLTETSDYPDCSVLAVAAAVELFGEEDPRVAAVREAWRAVGLDALPSEDLPFPFAVKPKANGSDQVCRDDLPFLALEVESLANQNYPAGTEITGRAIFRYQGEAGPISTEVPLDTLVLQSPWTPGRVLTFAAGLIPENPIFSTDVNVKLVLTEGSGRVSTDSSDVLVRINQSVSSNIFVTDETIETGSACAVPEVTRHELTLQLPTCSGPVSGEIQVVFTGEQTAVFTHKLSGNDEQSVEISGLADFVNAQELGPLERLSYEVRHVSTRGNVLRSIYQQNYRRFFARMVDTQTAIAFKPQEIAEIKLAINPAPGAALEHTSTGLVVSNYGYVPPEDNCISLKEHTEESLLLKDSRLTTITTCVDGTRFVNPQLSFELTFLENINRSPSANEYLRWVAITVDDKLIAPPVYRARNRERVIFDLPRDYSGPVTINVAAFHAGAHLGQILITGQPRFPRLINDNKLRLAYTNPVAGERMKLRTSGPIPQNTILRFHDATGRLLLSHPLQRDMELDISTLPTGVIYLTATDNDSFSWSGKLLRIR